MRRVFAVVMLLLALPAVAQPAAPAQADVNAPIVLWAAGDLYAARANALDQPPQRLTESGVISGPALSPDGARLAYRAAAPVGLEALSRLQTSGGVAEFDLPADIYLFDLAQGTASMIAGQPADASLFVEGVPDRAAVRSAPTWSPDGAQIAWTELAFGDSAAQLYLYDIARGLTGRVEINAPVVRGAAPAVLWGEGGLAISAGEIIPGQPAFALYTPDGLLRGGVVFAAALDEALETTAWIDVGGMALLGGLFSSGRWIIVDPATGLQASPDLQPELVARGDPQGSLGLRFGADPDVGMFWETADPSGVAPGGAFPAGPGRATLSPSGRSVAFLGYPGYTAAALWNDGVVSAVSGTGADALDVGAVLWGPTRWQVREVLTAEHCPGFLPSRMIVGGSGYVLTPAGDQMLYDAPSFSAAQLGIVAAGGMFEVLEGPQCAEETAWWRVQAGSLTGWLAEGEGDRYWLTPPLQ